MTIRQALVRLMLLSGAWFGLGVADWVEAGPITYSVSVDTSSINGVSGSFDLEFNPGGAGSLAATATIANFTTDAALLPPPGQDGDVSGNLQPGPLTINNTDAANDYFESLTFGNSIQFDVTLSGPALDNPNTNDPGSVFALLLADSNGNPLLTTDTTYGGSVAVITANSDGSTTPLTFPASPGGSPAATVTPEGSAAPEPSTLVLSLIGLAGLAGSSWRRRKRAS